MEKKIYSDLEAAFATGEQKVEVTVSSSENELTVATFTINSGIKVEYLEMDKKGTVEYRGVLYKKGEEKKLVQKVYQIAEKRRNFKQASKNKNMEIAKKEEAIISRDREEEENGKTVRYKILVDKITGIDKIIAEIDIEIKDNKVD